MDILKNILSDLPNMAEVKLDDSIQLNQYRIMNNIAANTDSNESHNYSFYNEIVEINGVESKIQDILQEKKYSCLIELENYLAQFCVHITSVYEYFLTA